MRSSKDRTIEKKRRNKAMGAKRTELSRARRVSNKHKRQEIRDIDPNLKVFIMDEKIYNVHGTQIEVVNGKIKPVLVNGIYELAEEKTDEMTKKYGKTFNIQNPAGGLDKENTYNAESDGGRSINDQVEKERLGVINKLDNEVIEGIKIKNKSALERLTDRFKKNKIAL